ncbi:transposable element Tc3 transposase [Trichonephila clavipes]|nr:transposable element Tc3 transposase [Trichonephila clavipes]
MRPHLMDRATFVVVVFVFIRFIVDRALASNSGEDMDVCKRILPLRHGCTLNRRRAASPLVRWVEGKGSWPPRSCDLTPLDYFLWGYVKSLIYADKPQTLDHLEDNIRRVIADIRPQMLEKVIENWTSRLDYIRASRASPMPEIIFKM